MTDAQGPGAAAQRGPEANGPPNGDERAAQRGSEADGPPNGDERAAQRGSEANGPPVPPSASVPPYLPVPPSCALFDALSQGRTSISCRRKSLSSPSRS